MNRIRNRIDPRTENEQMPAVIRQAGAEVWEYLESRIIGFLIFILLMFLIYSFVSTARESVAKAHNERELQCAK